MRRLLHLLIALLMLSIAFAATPDPGHDASRIGPGAFPAGNFSFDGSVGIGTVSPTAKLHVNGSFSVQNTSGSSHLYVNSSSGNVGVGTTSPGAPLHINVPITSVTDSLILSRDGVTKIGFNPVTAGTPSAITFYGTAGADIDASSSGRLRFAGPSGTSFVFADPGGDKISIVNGALNIGSGYISADPGAGTLLVQSNVGIGTAAPTAKLDVNGSVNLSGTSSVLYTPQICLNGDCETSWPSTSGASSAGGWTNTSTNVSLYSNTTNVSAGVFFIDNTNGRVGISTVTPTSKVEIGSGTLTVPIGSSGAPSITFSGDTDTGIYHPGADQVSLKTGDTEVKLQFGNVYQSGSGTIGYLLNGHEAFQELDSARIQFGDGYRDIYIDPDASTGQTVRFFGSENAANIVMYVNANKTVGIGDFYPYQPTATLHVKSNNSNGTFWVQNETATHLFVNGSSGNVGIGTALPTQILDVNGSVNISGTSGKLHTPELCLNGDCETSWPSGADGSGGWTNTSTTTSTTLNVNITGTTYLGTGSAGAPILASGNDPDTGLYWAGGDSLRIATGGQQRVEITSNGYVVVGSGAELSPSDDLNTPAYTFVGDTNTGIYTPAADTLGFVVGATEVVRINGSRVGIGTTEPLEALHVEGNAIVNGSSYFGFKRVDDNVVRRLIGPTQVGVGGTYYTDIGYPSSVSAGIRFFSQDGATDPNMFLSSNGNLGVGIFSPTAKLHVNGSLSVQNTSGSSHLYVDSSTGNVGIGTSAPSGKLHIDVPDQTGLQTQLNLSMGTRQSWAFLREQNEKLILRPQKSTAGQDSKFHIQNASGSTVLVVNTENNRVGIGGITTPSYALEVFGSANVSNILYTPQICLNGDCETSWPSAADGTGGWTNTTTTTSTTLNVDVTNSSGSSHLYVNSSSGNIGVGTATPEAPLDVQTTTGSTALKVSQGNTNAADTDALYVHSNASFGTVNSDRTVRGQVINLTPTAQGITNGTLDIYGTQQQVIVDTGAITFQAANNPTVNVVGSGSAVDAENTLTNLVGRSAGGPFTLNLQGMSSSVTGALVYDSGASQGTVKSYGGYFSNSLDRNSGSTQTPLIEKYGIYVSTAGTTNAETAYGVYIGSGGSANTQYALYLSGPGAGSTKYALYASSDAKSYFGGSIGIGTTEPTQALDVNGSVNISGASAKLYTPEICLNGDCETSWPTALGNVSGTGKANHLAFWINESHQTYDDQQLYWNDSNDRFGIGSTSPTQALHVAGNANVTGTLYASNISSNSPLQLQTNGTTRIYINDTTGNVGIGTTTPTSPLTIAYNTNNITASGIQLSNSQSTATSVINVVNDAGEGGSFAIFGSAYGLPQWRNQTILSGTKGVIIASNVLNSTGGADNVSIYAGGYLSEVARFSRTGLGLNTTAPSYTLDVTGTGRLTGALTAASINTGSGAMELGDVAVANGDTNSVPTGDQVYDFVTGQGYITDGNTGWDNSYGFITDDTSVPKGDLVNSGTLGFDWALSEGGTGASLADPGADRIMFWDDSAGAVTWLTVGAGLSVSTTTISASGDTTADTIADDGSISTGETSFADQNVLTTSAVTFDSLTLTDALNVGGEADLGYQLYGTQTESVNASTYAPITHTNGGAIDVNYIYKITAITTGVGTDTGAAYLLDYDPGTTAWTVRLISSAGNSANHPEIFLDSGTPSVRLAAGAPLRNVRIIKEAIHAGVDDATPHVWGAEYQWTRDGDALSYTDGTVTVSTIDTGSGAMELGDVAVANGDTNSVPTGDQVYDFVTGQGYITSEVDGSTANEIQTLGTSGNNITLTSGGTVEAPYAAAAGDLSCADCISETEISDVYLLNTGDTATGNYTFDTDTLHVDSTNNRIGIGTAEPTAALHIAGLSGRDSTPDVIGIQFDSGVGGADASIQLADSGGTPFIGFQDTLSVSAEALIYYEGSTDEIRVGSADLYASADLKYVGTLSDVSDARAKTDIRPWNSSLQRVRGLKPVSFKMKDLPNKPAELGFIAQDVREVFPEAVIVPESDEEYLGINYMAFIPLLTESVKELDREVQSLKAGGTRGNGPVSQDVQLLNQSITQLQLENQQMRQQLDRIEQQLGGAAQAGGVAAINEVGGDIVVTLND